jgi:hypothetical protein
VESGSASQWPWQEDGQWPQEKRSDRQEAESGYCDQDVDGAQGKESPQKDPPVIYWPQVVPNLLGSGQAGREIFLPTCRVVATDALVKYALGRVTAPTEPLDFRIKIHVQLHRSKFGNEIFIEWFHRS